jgi:hypothetical protein
MKWWLVTGLVTALVVAAPAPARADSARPTNYRSTVTGIEPETSAMVVEIRGGDAFVSIRQLEPVEIIVSGYQDEPYLRIDPDGVVWVNTNSPAYYLNENRFPDSSLPGNADAGAEPEWVQVGSGGQFGWHDHRTHWMSPEPPPGVDQEAESHIQEWTIAMTVDGVPTDVTGTLVWEPTVPPLPWILVAAAAAVALIWAARRGRVVPALVAGGVAATLVGIAQALESPLGFVSEVLAWLPGVVALVLAAMAVRRGPSLTWVGVATVILGVWVGPRLTTLTMPVLPTALPVVVERVSVSVVLAAVLAMAYWVVLELRPEDSSTLL